MKKMLLFCLVVCAAVAVAPAQTPRYMPQGQVVPPYAQGGTQPFGGAFGYAYGQSAGPKSSDAVGQFLDGSYGVPQWIFNSSKLYDARHTTWPAMVMNFTGQSGLTGTYVNVAGALNLQANYWMGGRTFGSSDNMNGGVGQATFSSWTAIQGGGAWTIGGNAYGGGDNLGEAGDLIGWGGPTPDVGEGDEWLNHQVSQGASVFSGSIASVSAASDGTLTLTTSGQSENGTQGEDRILTDTTSVYNAGYISAISGNSNTDESVSCAGGCDWDGTFGTSTKTTLTAAVQNPVNGTNSFPQSNVNLAVASSTGFTVGSVIGIYGTNYECEKVTAIPDGTHVTIATDRLPHKVGAYVVTGGMTCRVIRLEADDCTPANGCRGFGMVAHVNLTEPLYMEIPIMYNVSGNKAYIMQGGDTMPGTASGYTGSAYLQMAGSGGTCTATVSGGHVTGVTVSGGSGYLSLQDPPQIVFSGSWTTAPSAYITGLSGGGVTAAAVYSQGTGVTSATCTIQAENPYDIYNAAKVVQVYDPAPAQASCPAGQWNGSSCNVGAIDGKLITEPWPATPSVGDSIQQQPYYYQHTSYDAIRGVGQYFPALVNAGLSPYGGNFYGPLQGNDIGIAWRGNGNFNNYAGYPSAPNLLGYGQSLPPIFESVVGFPARQYHVYDHPPFAPGGGLGAVVSGYNPAINFVNNCGSAYTSPWWLSGTQGNAQADGWLVNCSTDTIYGIAKNIDLSASTVNLGAQIITSNSGANFGNEQNWNAYSNTFNNAAWGGGTCVGSSATVSADNTVTDPYNGSNAWKVIVSNYAAGGCIDTAPTTNLTNGASYSGHLWIKAPLGDQVCVNIGNKGTNCTDTTNAGWQKVSIAGATPDPSFLSHTMEFYAASANFTFWVYNASTVAGNADVGEAVTTAQQTTSSSVNQIAGKDICLADGTNCPTGSSSTNVATLTAGTVTVSNSAACNPGSSCNYQLTHCSAGGTVGILSVGTVTAGTSFVINSSSATDTSQVCWRIN